MLGTAFFNAHSFESAEIFNSLKPIVTIIVPNALPIQNNSEVS